MELDPGQQQPSTTNAEHAQPPAVRDAAQAARRNEMLVRGGDALARHPQGRDGWVGLEDGEGLAKFLGWFGIALGAMEVLAPHGLARLIGIRPSRTSGAVLRAMGVREIVSGLGILANPRSKEWVGSRVGGDVIDLALLGAACVVAEKPGRTLAAAAAVLGVSALDVLGTEQLAEGRKSRAGALQGPESRVLRSVTVRRPPAEVFAFWRDFTNLPKFMRHLDSVETLNGNRLRWRASGPMGVRLEWESEVVDEAPSERIEWRSVDTGTLYHCGTVRFRPAPRDEGTVVTVEMDYAPPGGRIAAALLKVLRGEPGQRLGDDLRRLKQLLETGEVLLSDASQGRGIKAARPHAIH